MIRLVKFYLTGFLTSCLALIFFSLTCLVSFAAFSTHFIVCKEVCSRFLFLYRLGSLWCVSLCVCVLSPPMTFDLVNNCSASHTEIVQ